MAKGRGAASVQLSTLSHMEWKAMAHLHLRRRRLQVQIAVAGLALTAVPLALGAGHGGARVAEASLLPCTGYGGQGLGGYVSSLAQNCENAVETALASLGAGSAGEPAAAPGTVSQGSSSSGTGITTVTGSAARTVQLRAATIRSF